ncbi:MAG: hypothetical protein KAS86_00645 [Candidatus Omnitrophica bacterium]|nr:hypothetical protein [Candidatus Omnitrophota bacterium]
MNKEKRDITILAIGDKADYDSYRKWHHAKASFLDHGFDYATTDYTRLLDGKMPRIKTENVIIFLFFPFSYWDSHIEHKNYRGIYANRVFYRKFVRFWDMVESRLKKQLAGKKVVFVNDPRLCGAYRDKLTVTRKLDEFRIPQSRLYNVSGVEEIRDKLSGGHEFFIKPRYGSMGKGITFLSRSGWQTNFIFKNNKIISRRSDHGWRFNDVTGKTGFLRQLLRDDFLIQKAVDPLILDGNKVDFRIYTFFNKVIYVYPRKNASGKVTTNISQGGQGDSGLLEILPGSLVSRAEKEAVRVSKALNINFAGIDIMPDKNLKDLYVLDVNVFSGLPGKKTFDLAECVAGELSKKGRVLFS